MHILVVEDDVAINNLLKRTLNKVGYQVTETFDGASAADYLEKEKFNLALVDIMLPEVDGFELLPYLKEYGVPTIFLTARDKTSDKVKGLSLGADDYITKPFDIEELLARIAALLRRTNNLEELIYGDIVIDVSKRQVKKEGEIISLTPKEFDLFYFLVVNKNVAVSREMIYENVWESEEYEDTRTLDLHIQRIRSKLGLTKKIRTIYKLGYILE